MRFFFFLLLVAALPGLAQQAPVKQPLQQLPATPAALPRKSPMKNYVPAYQIPKGNIFCRMEDAVTRKTGVWLKVGVTDYNSIPAKPGGFK